jgi:hypothetical protein
MDKKDSSDTKVDHEGYTQREWDRVVGIGKVPEEYVKRYEKYEEKRRRYEHG